MIQNDTTTPEFEGFQSLPFECHVAPLRPIQPILSGIVVLGFPNSSWCPNGRVSKFPGEKNNRKMGRLGEVGEARNLITTCVQSYRGNDDDL